MTTGWAHCTHGQHGWSQNHMRAGFTPGPKGEGVAVISKYSFRIFIHDQALHSSSCGGHLTKWHKQMTDKIAYKSLDKTFLNFNTAAREKLEKLLLQKSVFYHFAPWEIKKIVPH